VWNLKTCYTICAVKGEQYSKIVELYTITIINEKRQILVISTQNGQIVRHIPKGQLGNPGAVVANREWLNDIMFSASPTVPLIYVGHGTSSQVSGVRFYPTS